MQIQVKSAQGIMLVPIESRMLADRKIIVEGEIDQEMACSFYKQVMLLNQENKQEYISLYINSPGGEINSGLLMYDVIQGSEAPIRIFCMGRAYSMAAILFTSGNHGRYITPNGEVMIHEPRLASAIDGTTSSIKSVADSMQKTKKKLDAILAKHTGKTIREVSKASSYDHYFSAEESIAFGLCDEITTDFNMQ